MCYISAAPSLEAVSLLASSVRPPVFARLLLASFVLGALLYGTPISLLHLATNRLDGVGRAFTVGATFHLLYGLFFAVGATAAGLLWQLASGLLRRRRQPATGTEDGGLLHPLLAGAATFHLAFWFLFFNYGLTYDEVPGFVGGFATMASWIALRTAGVAIAVAAVTWLCAAVARRLTARRAVQAAAAAVAVSAVAHGALGLLATGSQPPPPPPSQAVAASLSAANPRHPLVVIAVDGADWRIIDPLLAAGRLPHLAALLEAGTRADLATLPDSNSAVIWASIYTGAVPAEHGVEDFYTVHGPGLGPAGLFPVHRTYFKELAAALGRFGLFWLATVDRGTTRVPLLWEVADQAGQSIGLVDGYFYSYPALTPRHPDSFVYAYGLDYFVQAGADLDGLATGPEAAARFVQPIEALELARPFLDRPDWEWQSATLLARLRAGHQPRLLSLYTHQPDTVQHQAWRGMEPRWYAHVSARERTELGPQIPAFYESLDRFLGELVALVTADTAIVVLSDHGHAPTPLHSMDTQHRHGPPGMLVLAGGPFRAGARLERAHVLDLFPTLLYVLDLPLPEDGPGELLTAAFRPEALRQQAVRRVPTLRGTVAGPPIDSARSRTLDAENVRRLEALGYL